MRILCTICAKKNSAGLRNKNIKPLNKIPLVSRAITQAKKSNIFDNIVISTDSKKIIILSKKLKIETWFLRPNDLCKNDTAKTDVILHALKESEKFYKKKYDIIIDLDVTAPLRSILDIKNALNKFKKNKLEILFSVCESKKNPYFNMVEKINGKLKMVKIGKNINSRQLAPKVYDVNAAIYIWSRNALLRKKSFFSKKTDFYVMPRIRSVDIDDKNDWDLVNFYIKKNNND